MLSQPTTKPGGRSRMRKASPRSRHRGRCAAAPPLPPPSSSAFDSGRTSCSPPSGMAPVTGMETCVPTDADLASRGSGRRRHAAAAAPRQRAHRRDVMAAGPGLRAHVTRGGAAAAAIAMFFVCCCSVLLACLPLSSFLGCRGPLPRSPVGDASALSFLGCRPGPPRLRCEGTTGKLAELLRIGRRVGRQYVIFFLGELALSG